MLRMASHSVPLYLAIALPWSKWLARRSSASNTTIMGFSYCLAQRSSSCTKNRSRQDAYPPVGAMDMPTNQAVIETAGGSREYE